MWCCSILVWLSDYWKCVARIGWENILYNFYESQPLLCTCHILWDYMWHYTSGWCITPVDLWSMTLAVLEPNWNTSYSILPSHIISTFESCNHMGHVSLFWVHNITLLLADMTPVTMEKIWEVNLLYKGKQIALSVDTLGVVFFFFTWKLLCLFAFIVFVALLCPFVKDQN